MPKAYMYRFKGGEIEAKVFDTEDLPSLPDEWKDSPESVKKPVKKARSRKKNGAK